MKLGEAGPEPVECPAVAFVFAQDVLVILQLAPEEIDLRLQRLRLLAEFDEFVRRALDLF